MIAFNITKSYTDLFRQHFRSNDVYYNPKNEKHRQLMYECTCLQWKMNVITMADYLDNSDPYFCSVIKHDGLFHDNGYKCHWRGRNVAQTTRSIVAVYKMNPEKKYITIQEAITRNIIHVYNGYSGVVGFNFRTLGQAAVDHMDGFQNGVSKERIFFYDSLPADDIIPSCVRQYNNEIQVFQIFKYLARYLED